ncbi:cysteine desulfurase family protein [Pseudomonas typographi]|uniref:cysteine desulfurase n=1 Tax=Pseudomonas typographi TaxID=2715964 RepID=A0ABR7Z7W9_9PSED|nr:cysteine desulfurase family protein [Pseudomonas typographi]MBD1554663.1 cysteine desulfurase [Pseudomonas typographi]MBD1587132.1 cysteine desulfurase [Pseudomonas typographi]MBD1601418.1 cysteine desulfurase [Pseudomonas typographi]
MPTPPAYLDYAATTPIDDRVLHAMLGCMGRQGCFANPASSHGFGSAARARVEAARQQVAQALGAVAGDMVWTSGATESNNLAIKGIAQGDASRRHLVSSVLEHKAVIDTLQHLERHGFAVTWLQPDAAGLIQPEAVKAALRSDTLLVSLMWVNNELGTLTDVAAIGEAVRAHGALLHVDAVQAAGKLAIDLSQLPIDLLSVSAHKVYGPKGVGALYVGPRARPQLAAQMHGGGHEGGLRSGTLPTHQLVGMGTAFELAEQLREAEQARIAELAAYLRDGLLGLPGVSLNGCPDQRIANTINVHVAAPGFSSQALASEVAVSATSACSSAGASHVLQALGLPDEQARRSVRLSLGRYSERADVERAIAAVRAVLSAPAPMW